MMYKSSTSDKQSPVTVLQDEGEARALAERGCPAVTVLADKSRHQPQAVCRQIFYPSQPIYTSSFTCPIPLSVSMCHCWPADDE